MNEEMLASKLKERFDSDVNITFVDVQKNNGKILRGCNIRVNNESFAPVIYFNPNMSVDDAAAEIYAIYRQNLADIDYMNQGENDFIEKFKSKERFLDSVMPRLINTAKNFEELKTMPNKPFLNLSVVYYVPVLGGSAKVKNAHLEFLGVTLEECHAAALKNLSTQYHNIINFSEIIVRQSGLDIDDINMNDFPKMYYLSNGERYLGSAIMLKNDALNEMSSILGDDYYVIPSSIHELICINKGFDTEYLKKLIREVNATELNPFDFLSNSLYEVVNGEIQEVCV